MNLQLNQNETESGFSRPKININALVETTLPPSPDNIMRISGLLRDFNTPPRKITHAIVHEPMLVARILRLANSPIYGQERNVTSIETAISAIGNKTLLEIIMMGLASSTFDREIRNSIVARKIWEHSLAVALISRELSETLKIQGTEEAFTCGLLHDIGKLMLFSYDYQGFSMLLCEDDEDKMLLAEYEKYGYNHAEIGALVARRWNLQEEVCFAINYHHNPSQAAYPMIVAHIVEVADIIANVKGYGLRCEDESKILESQSTARLRLTEEDLENVWNNVKDSVDEVIRNFA